MTRLWGVKGAGGGVGFVASHPVARKKATGWGTEHLCVGKREKRVLPLPCAQGQNDKVMGSERSWWRGGIRGFPPCRQKKGDRVGHGAFVRGQEGKAGSSPSLCSGSE